MHYRDENGEWKELILEPSGDTLPVGSEVEFDGDIAPTGWEKVDGPYDYLADEKRIGTWMGKPLYRKIINITDFTPNDYHRVTIAPNCKIKQYDGYITRNSGNSVDGFSKGVGATYGSLVSSIRENQIEYLISETYINIETGYFVVEYTKTTDEEV